MSPVFTVIVVILAILAIVDLIVGVSNDAINFLNSSLGSKIASYKTIISVAAVGILVGVLTSHGMMEVARNGVFHPEMFTFSEIMFLYVGVMLTDVILLDGFNKLGLPTSTTVSMIFELLGASMAWEEREVEQILKIALHRRHLAFIHIHHITDGAEGVERYAYRGNNRQRVEIAAHYLVPRQHEEVGVFKHHQYAHRAQQRCAQHQLARPLRFGSGDAECQMPVDNRGDHHQQEYPPTRLEGEK